MLRIVLGYVDLAQLFAAAVVIGILGTTALLMILMMRRARQVNAHAAARRRDAEAEARSADPAIEEWDEARGQYVRRDPETNAELLRQGARARQAPSVIEP
ncbi:hypothetical protein [Sphingomonas sp.]|uniref:hypothetical protein n=1 Tax=Sphingomonas sp. TaxID=28214 RepID=UPI001B2F441C|nr:hypothetical protein [Sphingomonas sp.]MBO9713620.1 hypothetical protein [Sphingomonas sp.]